MALWQGPRLHSHRVPPVGLRLVNVAADRTVPVEVSSPRRPRLSPFAQCQIDAQASNVSRFTLYPKVQFGGDLWKNGQHTIQAMLDLKEQEVVSHTAEVP